VCLSLVAQENSKPLKFLADTAHIQTTATVTATLFHNVEVSHARCVDQLCNQKNVLNIWSKHNYISITVGYLPLPVLTLTYTH
jgi:hypothetical protein